MIHSHKNNTTPTAILLTVSLIKLQHLLHQTLASREPLPPSFKFVFNLILLLQLKPLSQLSSKHGIKTIPQTNFNAEEKKICLKVWIHECFCLTVMFCTHLSMCVSVCSNIAPQRDPKGRKEIGHEKHSTYYLWIQVFFTFIIGNLQITAKSAFMHSKLDPRVQGLEYLILIGYVDNVGDRTTSDIYTIRQRGKNRECINYPQNQMLKTG